MDEPGSETSVDGRSTPRQYGVELMDRHFRAYPIMDEELDALASAHSSVDQVFLGIVLGALMSVVITFVTGGVNDSNRLTYVWIAAGLIVATIYFGICAIADVRAARRRVDRVRRRGTNGDPSR